MAAKGKAKTIDIFIWDIETKSILGNLNDFHLRAVCQLAFSPDGTRLLSVGQDDDNSLAIHDWQSKILVANSKVDKAKVTAVAWKNDQQFVTCGVKHIKFWNISGRNLAAKKGVMGSTNFEPLVSVTYGFPSQICLAGSASG
jgi:WD40 repeat protein